MKQICKNCLEFCKHLDSNDGDCNLCFDEVAPNESCEDFKSNSYLGDCIIVMDELIEQGVQVDMILVDPPYAKTRGRWDVIIPLEDMWDKIDRILKPKGAVCIFGNEPYSSLVRSSNFEDYKYDWKWVKNRATGFPNCNYRPMNKYEDIMVFSEGNASTGGSANSMPYFPQGLKPSGKKKVNTPKRHGLIQQDTNNVGENNALMQTTEYIQKYTNYPNNILEFDCDRNYLHPTMKPIELLKYLTRTYTKKNELVLDFSAGSFSTAIACLETERRFICIDKSQKYFDIGRERVEDYTE